ncbi:MAG TPA: tetratricopeptide repeat protein [Thermoanaerobaculia bacterium]|jgi:cytochrome c-type biogenesis protein CcmH/NrfG|nr:tetratricopeptide repeat protein [Thermoanaerobaculia bacterium]
MNRGKETPAGRRFQLFQGSGEGEQLDRFLAGTDPILMASLQREEHGLLRSRKRRWGFAALLVMGGLAVFGAVAPVYWLADLLDPKAGLAEKAAANPEKEARVLTEQSRQHLSENRYNEALESATRAAQLAPGLADAWIALGDCQMKNYQSALSEQAYLKALALEPGSSRASLGLGSLYLRRGEERRAEEVWLRGGVDWKLAALYLLQGRFREAELRLRPLLVEGTEEELLFRMAEAARSRHLDPGLRSLLEPEPTGLSEWADLGWRLSRQERHQEAAAAFRKAVARVPRDVNALSGLGLSLLALNRTEEAGTYFHRALALDHDHVLSLNGLAQCLKVEGRPGEAIAVWQAMAQLYPGVNYGTPGLAWTYYELRDYPQAAVYFSRLVKRYPYDVRVIDALNIAVENISPMPH